MAPLSESDDVVSLETRPASREHAVTGHLSGSELLAAAKVLVVDDSEVNVRLLERLLRRAGIAQVHVLTDPELAVATCLELDPDVLLLDLNMPRLDGFAVMDRLAAVLPPAAFLPILVLTADNSATTRDRALGAGAKDFVAKPFDQTEVVLRVTNLLETGALYRRLEAHNARLQATLDERTAEERRVAAGRQRQVDRIRDVLDGNRLAIAFQPVVDLATNEIVGLEGLSRFTTEPVLAPSLWFGEAREVGLDTELEVRAATEAFKYLAAIPRQAFIAINLSPSVVMASDLDGLFAHADGRRVVLELTEHTEVEDYPALLSALDALRYQGVRVAVDDAGAGYAGLNHILQLLPDILKIDIELIRGVDRDPARRAMVRSLVAFAAEIGADVIAEGIETASELDELRRLGVGWGQGYYLARPGQLPLHETRIAAFPS